MKVAIVQPALPAYRHGLFARMAEKLGPGFSVYASAQSELGVLVSGQDRPAWQHDLGPMLRLLPGLEWQRGALAVPVSQGDVLVVCGAPRTLSNLALILKGKLKGARTIWWGHYWSATSRPWRAAIRSALMRVPDAIVFYTDQEVAEYRAQRRRQRDRKPAYGLNNGIETSEIVKLRLPYAPAARPRDLLFIGRITPKAEFGLLLEALARPECAGVRLDVVGEAIGNPDLRQQASAVSDRITWHDGTIDEARIAKVANTCKAFVYPGGVGLSLIHGLAYGLPAIVHDDHSKHMPEIAAFNPGHNGVTFRRGDPGSLAKAIAMLLTDGGTLERMSASAIATTDATFNTADMAERFVGAITMVSRHSTFPARSANAE
ncbi:MAG: glycosyltransferase family 4 protein [Hyphomicrobiaceae bacterium]